jgi:putative toxin-antitoxin system antitoxin component (TIGR02293 family)
MPIKKKSFHSYLQDDTVPAVVKEAAIGYGPSPSMKAVLGGKGSSLQVINTDIDLIELTRKGLKKDTLFYLAEYLGISMGQLSDLLHTSHRNLQRKDANETMDSYKTEKVLELASFAVRGTDVIGSEAGFREWLKNPITALDNKTPLDFLDTTFGIQMVLKILGRLEQGVYS